MSVDVKRLRARTAALCDCALVARADCPDCGGAGAVIDAYCKALRAVVGWVG